MIRNKLYQYALLMRLNRPVGFLLLLWPTLIALWFAGHGKPDPKIVLIFILGVIVMRSAGCVINDYADRHVDGQVTRTCQRPLVTGAVTSTEALGLFFGLLLIAFILAYQLNIGTLLLSLVGVVLAASYPFMKRWTYFPQVVLGAAFGWAVPMAYYAQSERLPLDCWILYLATLLWAVAYDTLYAMVDREDDKKVGIKSTAIWFGNYDRLAVGILQIIVLSLFVLLGKLLVLGFWFYLGIVFAFALVCYQLWLIRKRRPALCFQAFLNNQWVGASLFVGVCFDSILR